MIGKTVCYMHGGKTPVASGLPQTRHGRYSSYLPAKLAGKYEQSKSDIVLLELREEVSIIDSRIAELLERIDSNEAGHWWKVLHQTYSQFLDAKSKSDTVAMGKCLIEFGYIIEHGLSDYAVWDEISNKIEQRRRLVESERKRLVEMQQYVTAEQAMLLVSALIDVVTRHVSDRNTISAIYADVSKLTDKPGA